jgi:hypothetical protein
VSCPFEILFQTFHPLFDGCDIGKHQS